MLGKKCARLPFRHSKGCLRVQRLFCPPSTTIARLLPSRSSTRHYIVFMSASFRLPSTDAAALQKRHGSSFSSQRRSAAASHTIERGRYHHTAHHHLRAEARALASLRTHWERKVEPVPPAQPTTTHPTQSCRHATQEESFFFFMPALGN